MLSPERSEPCADDDLAAFGLPPAPAFALLHRPGTAPGQVEILAGEPVQVARVTDLPTPTGDGPALLAVLPYRQIADRGLACVDDGAPLIALRVLAATVVPVADALPRLPAGLPALSAARFDSPDGEYAATVRRVLDENIARGDGSNFVIRRRFQAAFARWSRRDALALFRRLVAAEQGAYWTFVVHWPGRTLAGATPECHLRLADGRATMNPISGTYRYPPAGPDTAGLLAFLGDRKEAGELLMVVDEELKMMAAVCAGGGRVRGPRLRPMARLAHTEYLIDGPTRLDGRELLARTTPAPTVTGSPVASACRVIAGHERTGRGYYGGVVALIGRAGGQPVLDSALIIRTAEIDDRGEVTAGVGATLVSGSDPAAEAAETRAKAATLIAALQGDSARASAARPASIEDARVRAALRGRNDGLSLFWRGLAAPTPAGSALTGRRLLIVDAEDDFTAMLARLAESLGVRVTVTRWDAEPAGDHDVVLVGPGPGDPRDRGDARIARLHSLVRALLAARTPMLAVCLGHQVLADELGLRVTRSGEPAQGVRRTISWDGRDETVGFYNSYAAVSDRDLLVSPLAGEPVRVLRDRATAAVHGLRTSGFCSAQFHLESILTAHGPALLREMLISVLAPAAVSPGGRPTRSVIDNRPDSDHAAPVILGRRTEITDGPKGY